MNCILYIQDKEKRLPIARKPFLYSQYFQLRSVKLCEVLDGANHLRGVGVLVVVPGNNLNLIGILVDLSNHGLSCAGLTKKTRLSFFIWEVLKYDIVTVVEHMPTTPRYTSILLQIIAYNKQK